MQNETPTKVVQHPRASGSPHSIPTAPWYFFDRKAQSKSLTRGCLDLHIVHRLHQTRRGHEESRVADAAGRGDDLAAAAVQRLCAQRAGGERGGHEGGRCESRAVRGDLAAAVAQWGGWQWGVQSTVPGPPTRQKAAPARYTAGPPLAMAAFGTQLQLAGMLNLTPC